MRKFCLRSVCAAVAMCTLESAALTPRHVCYRSFMKELSETRRFADSGIEIRCFTVGNTANSAGNPYCEYPAVWTGEGRYDWETVDREFADLVEASPKAKFIVLVDLNTPPWLQRRLRFDSFSSITLAVNDPDWLRLTMPWLEAFVDHAEVRWGSRIIGYVLGAGNCTEWTEFDYREGGARIQSMPALERSWRTWCASKGLDCGRYTPHGDELETAAFRNTLYDPAAEGAKIAYWKFRNETVSTALLTFAHAAKARAPGKEIGAFFGYYLLCNPNMLLSWNHMDYERVFDSPDIDFVITPANYTDRGPGGGTGSLLVQGSLVRRGKRLFHEIDFWTHGILPKGQVFTADYFKSEEDDIACNTREAAYALVTGSSLWWFDQWGGFYRAPRLFDRIVKLNRIAERMDGWTPVSRADVLFVADSASAYLINEKSSEVRGFPWRVRDELAKTGFAVDYYSFSDLASLDLARYRVVVFPGQFEIAPQQEAFLREALLKDGRTVVWFYAPGISDGRTLDLRRVEKWTGVPFGSKGLNEEDRGGWRSAYVADYESFDAEGLSGLLRRARAHEWVRGPAVVHASDRLVSVHVKEAGVRDIRLSKPARRVTEVLSGKVVAEGADSFKFPFQGPDTRIFEVEE